MNDLILIGISVLLGLACVGMWVALRSRDRAIERSRIGLDERIERELSSLERERRRTAELLERMDEGVLVLNDALSPVMANGAARRLLGFDQLPAVLGSDEILSIARRAAVDQVQVEGSVQVWPRRTNVLARAIPLADDGGIAVVLQDLTEELRTHRIRRQFVANASHELKSPVAGLQALGEAIRNAVTEDPATADRFAEKLVGESERLGRLIADLLDLSRLEDPANISRHSTNLSTVAEQEIRDVEPAVAAKGMRLDVDIASDVWVQGDDHQLGLMIGNLLDNAIRYTPEQGTIKTSLVRADGDAVLTVSDTGIGIPLKAQARVFERFYRVDKDRSRARGGTGLGLSIVKHVVELHGGHVSVDSELGEGSTFTVRLPVSAPEKPALTSKAS